MSFLALLGPAIGVAIWGCSKYPDNEACKKAKEVTDKLKPPEKPECKQKPPTDAEKAKTKATAILFGSMVAVVSAGIIIGIERFFT
jgi:hypothetical protein